MAGDRDEDELAALLEKLSLSSASNTDLAYQLQLAETIQASPESTDAAFTLALHAADLARTELDRRHARAYHARSAASVRVIAHDALFAWDLAAVPEDRWAHDGDCFKRPLEDSSSSDSESSPRPLFRVLFKGMASKDVVGPRDRDPGVAVLAAAVCGPEGEVLLSLQKPVEGYVGGREVLEAMALKEGLHAALTLSVRMINSNDVLSLLAVSVLNSLLDGVPYYYQCKCLVYTYILYHAFLRVMLGNWYIKQKKVADMIDLVLSLLMEFEQCEMLLVRRSEVGYVIKLARDSIGAQITKALVVDSTKDKRETCTICLEDTDVSKIHIVEGCAHRFCFSCVKEHVKVKLLHGMLPACPQDGCTIKLSVEGSKILLSPRLLEIMVERIREGQIPPTQKIYCPYPKCSALMSMSELIHPMQQSCSKYTVYTAADAATLRKCVKCRAQQKLWRQCVKCKHVIELAEGCYHMTSMCSYEFCYTCGKEWKEKKATCTCSLWDEDNIIHDESEEDYYYDEDEDDYYDEDDDDDAYYPEERGITNNQVNWRYDNERAHRPGNNYRGND
ncbi:hypothetical protein BS78_10G051600 [Paspalum vaginatum]|nr:hypothetical protein BS78_10G051600 [Paspalum vaginatum]